MVSTIDTNVQVHTDERGFGMYERTLLDSWCGLAQILGNRLHLAQHIRCGQHFVILESSRRDLPRRRVQVSIQQVGTQKKKLKKKKMLELESFLLLGRARAHQQH